VADLHSSVQHLSTVTKEILAISAFSAATERSFNAAEVRLHFSAQNGTGLDTDTDCGEYFVCSFECLN
jgi:hypothetical protein